MPLFMDRHSTRGLSVGDVARAHGRDLEVQDRFGVRFTSYLFDETAGVTFCLVDSPTRDAVIAAHTAAHGVGPEELIEVDPRTLGLFLGPAATATTPANWSGLRIILITDVVGSTENIERLGEVAAMEIVLAHDRLVREQVARCHGREIDHTGDGMMVSFDSVTAALTCAITIQRAIEPGDHADASRFSLRIGLAAGEPVERDRRLFGAAVNLAARACSTAQPREILVTSAVKDLAAGKPFTFEDHGAVELKGFERPVPLFTVRRTDPPS